MNKLIKRYSGSYGQVLGTILGKKIHDSATSLKLGRVIPEALIDQNHTDIGLDWDRTPILDKIDKFWDSINKNATNFSFSQGQTDLSNIVMNGMQLSTSYLNERKTTNPDEDLNIFARCNVTSVKLSYLDKDNQPRGFAFEAIVNPVSKKITQIEWALGFTSKPCSPGQTAEIICSQGSFNKCPNETIENPLTATTMVYNLAEIEQFVKSNSNSSEITHLLMRAFSTSGVIDFNYLKFLNNLTEKSYFLSNPNLLFEIVNNYSVSSQVDYEKVVPVLEALSKLDQKYGIRDETKRIVYSDILADRLKLSQTDDFAVIALELLNAGSEQENFIEILINLSKVEASLDELTEKFVLVKLFNSEQKNDLEFLLKLNLVLPTDFQFNGFDVLVGDSKKPELVDYLLKLDSHRRDKLYALLKEFPNHAEFLLMSCLTHQDLDTFDFLDKLLILNCESDFIAFAYELYLKEGLEILQDIPSLLFSYNALGSKLMENFDYLTRLLAKDHSVNVSALTDDQVIIGHFFDLNQYLPKYYPQRSYLMMVLNRIPLKDLPQFLNQLKDNTSIIEPLIEAVKYSQVIDNLEAFLDFVTKYPMSILSDFDNEAWNNLPYKAIYQDILKKSDDLSFKQEFFQHLLYINKTEHYEFLQPHWEELKKIHGIANYDSCFINPVYAQFMSLVKDSKDETLEKSILDFVNESKLSLQSQATPPSNQAKNESAKPVKVYTSPQLRLPSFISALMKILIITAVIASIGVIIGAIAGGLLAGGLVGIGAGALAGLAVGAIAGLMVGGITSLAGQLRKAKVTLAPDIETGETPDDPVPASSRHLPRARPVGSKTIFGRLFSRSQAYVVVDKRDSNPKNDSP